MRSLMIYEKALGRDHPSVASSVNHLAELYRETGRYGDAEPLNKCALAILEKALGPDHPDVATSLINLAKLHKAQGRVDLDLEHIRRASAIHRKRAALTGGGRSSGGFKEQRTVRHVFLYHLQATVQHPTDDPIRRNAMTVEGFEPGFPI